VPNPFAAKWFRSPSDAWARRIYLPRGRMSELGVDGVPDPATDVAPVVARGRVGGPTGAAVHVFSVPTEKRRHRAGKGPDIQEGSVFLAWMRRSLPSVARTRPAARPAAKISTVVLIALTISTEVNIVRVAAEGPCSAQIPVRPKS
jgi:hypothetical protein